MIILLLMNRGIKKIINFFLFLKYLWSMPDNFRIHKIDGILSNITGVVGNTF